VSEPVRIEIDVTAVAPSGATVEVGDLFLPEGGAGPGDRAAPIALVVCLPGGGMTRRWFDLPAELPGRWSLARHLAEEFGLAVLTLDHLGVGESPAPDDPYTLIPRVVAAVHAHVVATVVERLRAGTLVPDVGPLEVGPVVGCGHSMGAMIIVQQQARHRSYDAVALLGFGGAGLPEHLDDDERGYAGDHDELELALPALVAARFGGALVPSSREVRERPVGVPLTPGDLLGHATGVLLALGGLTSMIPGTSDREMAAIDVPVLAVVGENDIVREVERLPQLFVATPELTEFVLPGSGHNHVIAVERMLLFDELGRWVTALGPRRRG
jgi:pimeloyl-ACP methyl ester carboxylesterase